MMINIKLKYICVGNNFKQGYISSIISPTEIILNSGENIPFDDLEPIELTIGTLAESTGYSADNKINNFAKILTLEDPKIVYVVTYEPGIYLSDLNNNIISNRIKYLHEFQNIESMLIDWNTPFNQF